jgi:hypothetical protein
MRSGGEISISDVKKEIGRLPKGPGRRISTDLGRRIEKVVRSEMAAGRARSALARELGVSMTALNRVLEVHGQEGRPANGRFAGFVQIEPTHHETGAFVRLPGGIIIEGMRLDEIVAFAREMM